MMVSEPIDLPEDLIRKMRKHPEVNWDEVIENSVRNQIEDLEKSDHQSGWKQEFIESFCGVIKGEVKEISNVKEIWSPNLDL